MCVFWVKDRPQRSRNFSGWINILTQWFLPMFVQIVFSEIIIEGSFSSLIWHLDDFASTQPNLNTCCIGRTNCFLFQQLLQLVCPRKNFEVLSKPDCLLISSIFWDETSDSLSSSIGVEKKLNILYSYNLGYFFGVVIIELFLCWYIRLLYSYLKLFGDIF